MKSTYEARATKAARVFAKLFEGCDSCRDFRSAIDAYNDRHMRKVAVAWGMTRFVILRADYVIKFEYSGTQFTGRAGNNTTEAEVYEKACEDGYEYLLAKPTIVEFNGFTISIMPRINGVGNGDRSWQDYCTVDECDWLFDTINDLHSDNVGYRDGHVVAIDYAWSMAALRAEQALRHRRGW